jgi:uncharacterized RDD family membrane protein YckC/Tfp pilus assembly protein PilE
MQKEVAWYFVDLLGQRKGPMSQQQLLDAVADGRLRPATLVWREGLAQWQPLSSLEHELRPTPKVAASQPPTMPPPPIDTNPFATSPSGFVNDWAYATQSNEVVYSDVGRRFLALMLDSIIVTVTYAVLVAILLPTIAKTAPGHAPSPWLLLFYPATFLFSLLYWSVQESSSHQATFGKRALGIKVVDLDGKSISWGRAVGRWFARLLSGFFFCIGYLLALFTSRKQTLHDMLAGTLVVDRWAYTRHPERQKHSGSGALVVAIVLLLGFVAITSILAAIAIPAYQSYVMRSQVVGAYMSADALKPAWIEAYRREGRCPTNGEAGLSDANEYGDRFVSAITMGASSEDPNQCMLDATIRSTNQAVDGKHIWLSTSPAAHKPGWTCTSDLPPKYLPMQCR